jgi:putative phage-type endonuclease
MDQGSNAWLEWRNQGIGSSDAPVIMGVSPYKTPRKLYLEKRGEALPEGGNEFIFEKGHKTEAQARSLLEIEYGGISFPPMLCQMIDHPWLRASLDGFSESEGAVKEFKLVSKAEFDAGVCPARYYPQIQHQYMVTNAKTVHIVLCCHVGKLKLLKIKEIYVPCDPDYIRNELAPALLDFWWRVKNGVPPDLMPDDATRIKDKKLIAKIKEYKAAVKKWEKLHQQANAIYASFSQFQDEILDMMPEDYMRYQKEIYCKQVVKKVSIECL